jgi:hypothetical protein
LSQSIETSSGLLAQITLTISHEKTNIKAHYWRRRVSELVGFAAAVLVEWDVDRKCVNQLSYVNASLRLGRTGRFVGGGRGLIFGL